VSWPAHSSHPEESNLGTYGVPSAIFLIFLLVYILLRSNDFFAVDGSFRCLEVYRYPELFFRSNNHLFYTADAWWWSRLAATVGYRPGGPVQFLHLIELMNCLAGAAALAIFCYLVFGVTRSWQLAIVTAAALGLSRAFSAQAVNSNEPMPGVLWSFVAVALAARAAQKRALWAAAGGGVFLGLAMVTYRSMVLLAPAAVALLLLGEGDKSRRFSLSKGGIGRAAALVLSGIASAACLHGWAYWRMGERTLRGMISRFSVTDGSQFYFGLRFGRVLNIPIGMARNLFAVEPEYTGARAFLDGPKGPVFLVFLLIAAIFAFLFFCAVQIARNWADMGRVQRTGVIAGCTGFVFTFVPVLVWDPQYDKLWVQPLACLFFLIAIAWSVAKKPSGASRIAAGAFAALALFGACISLHWTYKHHVNEPIEFQEAENAAQLIGKNDFVVGEWRGVSLLYGYLWAYPQQYLSFPSEAIAEREHVMEELRDKIKQTEASSGKVYFFGILDIPKKDWDPFFAQGCGIPYSALDEYRARAKVLARYRDKHGVSFLWELD